jgi:nitrate reductase alpha subunit
MSMVSYAAGTRYLSLLGGTCLSFYDWYCDPPPASPMTWGEQTDAGVRRLVQLSYHCLGLERAADPNPDAHFFTEVPRAPKPSPSRRTSRKSRS